MARDVIIVTRPDSHNQTFLDRLDDRAHEAGLADQLDVLLPQAPAHKRHPNRERPSSGLDESDLQRAGTERRICLLRHLAEAIAKARVEFQTYRSEHANEH